MIHRESRNRLAETLRHYVSGHITNDDLAGVSIDWRDRGANAVYQMAWGLYDDTYQHSADGDHRITAAGKREIARWIAFLYSDEEYIWPEYSLMRIVNWPMNVLTLGWWERWKKKRWEEFLEAGDFSAWPFASKDALEKVRHTPKLLRGRVNE